MAISRSATTANETLRSNFGTSMSASDYTQSVGVGYGNSYYRGGDPNDASNTVDPLAGNVAGIRTGFLTALDNALTEYESGLNTILDKLETNPNIAQAFRGQEIESAIKNLISAVKAEAGRYVAAMKAAEVQIIQSVVTAYQSQDTTVSSSMNSDTSALS